MNRISRSRVWIYGKHASFAALQNPLREIYEIRCTASLKAHVLKLRPESHVMIADEHVLSKIIHKNHQGIIVCCKPLPKITKITSENLEPISRIMIIDKMHDTHNIGSIMRSMVALKFDALITDNRHNFESEACKTSSGAIETVKIFQVSNIINAIKQLKENDFWIIGLDQDGRNIQIHDIPKLALVIGAEDKGIRTLLYKQCDKILSIGHDTKFPLNASVAASIGMHIATHGM